jgi:hypothetical protein
VLATLDLQGLGVFLAGAGSILAAILSYRNGTRLRAKAVGDGARNIFGRPKKKNIGDLVALLEARTARFDRIEASLDRLLHDIEGERAQAAVEKQRELVRYRAAEENERRRTEGD